MQRPKPEARARLSRSSPAHLLEILVWLAHLAWLLLVWLSSPASSLPWAGLAMALVIMTAIPFGPLAGLASGLSLALLEVAVRFFQSGAQAQPSLDELLRTATATWPHLVFWPLAGLAIGLYGTGLGRVSRRQRSKAWQTARANEQLKAQVESYENRLTQLLQPGHPAGHWDAGQADFAPLDTLVHVLLETLGRNPQIQGDRPGSASTAAVSTSLFELIVQKCPATVAILDPNGIIRFRNVQLLATFGLAGEGCQPGRPFARLLAPESALQLQTILSSQDPLPASGEPALLTLALPGLGLGQTVLAPEVIVSPDEHHQGYLVRLSRHDLNLSLQPGWPAAQRPGNLADLLSQELCCLAPDGSVTCISAKTASQLGETEASLLGRKWSSFISTDSMESFNQAIRDCRNGLASRLDLVLYPYARKGKLIYQAQVFPSLDQTGNLVALTLRLSDQTASKQTESLLSRRLDIEQMITQISSRFIAVKPDGLEQEIMAALRLVCEFENALECSIEMVPSSYFQRRSAMSYQNENRHSDLKTALDSPTNDRFEIIGVPIEIDSETVAYIRIRQDKYHDLWFDSDLKLIRLIGEIIVNAQIRHDHTQAIRLNERRLATTLLSMGEGVIATDPKGRVILMNRRAEQMTGWEQDSAKNLVLGQIFSPAKVQVTDAAQDRWAVNPGHPLSETDNSLLLVAKTGERFYISTTTSRVEDEKGQLYGEVTVFRDVTQSKKENDAIRYISYHDRLTGLYNRAFFEEEMHRLNTCRQYPITIILGDCNGLKISNDIFGHLEGDRLLKAIAQIIRLSIRHEDIAARWGGDEFAIILPQTDEPGAQVICERILNLCASSNHRPIPPSLALGCATASSMDTDLTDLLKLAEDRMYRHKLMEGKTYRKNLISSIEKMIHEKSFETEDHVSRLSALSSQIGQAIGLGDSEMAELRLLCVLHDVGKIGIPDKILAKEGPLNREEWEVVRKHPEKGYNLAKATPELKNIAEAILHHHERWDGTGYPSGLKGEQIPLLARVLAIIDTFDVITHTRSYKKAQSVRAALREIDQCAGGQFDPELSRIFISIMQEALEA